MNLRKFTLLFTACLALCGLGTPGAFGQPPSLINFRGQLLDNGGQPVTASVAVELRIFSAATGGTELYLEDMGYIEVRGGQYAFQFGANGNPDLASVIQGNAEAWVEVTVDNNALPRQRFVSVPYALNAGSAQIASGAVTREMLSQEILDDLNRTQISNGSITHEMLNADLNQTISMGFAKGSFDIQNPFGWDGEFITHTDSNFTVPEDKVLVIISGKEISLGLGGKVFRQLVSGYSIVPSNAYITSVYGWTGLLLDPVDGVSSVLIEDSVYQVPTGKKLVITSSAYTIFASGEEVFWNNSKFGVIESGQTLNIQSGFHQAAFSGYLIDENRSLGGGFIPSADQESSVTPSMLSDSILKYLRPEIVEEPSFTGAILNGTRVELNPGVEGKYVTYQWYKDGEPIDGATSQLFTIDNFDIGHHDGNYTVVASNDFGSVESLPIELVQTRLSTHTTALNASVALEMIWVEPGTFTMGQDGLATPVHEVTLTQGFYLGKYEVTQAQYEAVMTGNTDSLNATPSNWPNNPDRPVEKVSYDDIQKFLTRLNTQQAGNIPEGWAYVLPTEAQWEYACRAGTTTAYSWGDSITTDNANYSSSGYSQTRDVGQYSANPWGFFDMHGNVWEWTADAWGSYATGAQTDPFNVSTAGSNRVSRGGSWNDPGAYLRSAYRYNIYPSGRGSAIGFRVGFQQQ